MKVIINHIADFSSLGGVQSYIYGLCNKFPENYFIYNSGTEVLDIYKSKSIKFKKIKTVISQQVLRV